MIEFSKKKKEFAEIYDKYVKKIFRFVYLKVDSVQLAEDITSETFLRGWQAYSKTSANLEDFKNNNGKNNKEISPVKNPQAFLFQIARNLIVDYYRRRSRENIVSFNELGNIPDPKDSKKEIDMTYDMLRIKAAISQLKDEDQELIILRYVNELSIPEISKILNKTENATRVSISRALERLRKIIQET